MLSKTVHEDFQPKKKKKVSFKCSLPEISTHITSFGGLKANGGHSGGGESVTLLMDVSLQPLH